MNETINALTTRKSCCNYKPLHISREDLDEIIAAGLNAPSGMNFQESLLIAIQDEKVVAELSALNCEIAKAQIAKIDPEASIQFPSDPFYGAKDVIAVVAKKTGLQIYDGSLVMGNLMNAAWSKGIDSRWIHRCKETFESEYGKNLLAKLGITDDVEGIGFCILGYAQEEKEKTEIKEGRTFYV